MITTDQQWSEEGQLTTEGNRVMGTQDSLMCVGNECYAVSQLARSLSAHAEQWKKIVSGCVCIIYLQEEMAPECATRRRQASGGSCTKLPKASLWAMFCWETSGPAIYVDVILTCSTSVNNVADQVHPFMKTIFPNCL